MKLFDKLALGVERAYVVASTQIKCRKPQIKMAVGACAVVYGAYAAYKAGKRSKEENYKGRLEDQKKEIDSGFAPRSMKEKAKRKATVKYVCSEAVNVLPAVAGTTCGLFLMKSAFDNVMTSKRVLEAALAASVASAQKLDEIVVESVGEKDRDVLVNGGKFERTQTKVQNNDGTFRTKSGTNVVFNVDDIFDLPGESFVYSKETCAGMSFQDNEDYFNSLVIDARAAAEQRLRHTHGYCFDADIVRLFGVEPKAIHRTNGSVNPDPKHPRPGDERRGIYDLITQPIQIEYEDGSRTKGWLITPVNDGVIIDIYPQYSLQRLLIKNRLEWKNRHESGN